MILVMKIKRTKKVYSFLLLGFGSGIDILISQLFSQWKEVLELLWRIFVILSCQLGFIFCFYFLANHAKRGFYDNFFQPFVYLFLQDSGGFSLLCFDFN